MRNYLGSICLGLIQLLVGFLQATEPGVSLAKPSREELLKDCQSSDGGRFWYDCTCYVGKLEALSQQRDPRMDTRAEDAASGSCLDERIIQTTREQACLRRHSSRPTAPYGLDKSEWCACYSRAVARGTLAIPDQPFRLSRITERGASDKINFEADQYCKKVVTTKVAPPSQGGPDLYGRWLFSTEGLTLSLVAPPRNPDQVLGQRERRSYRHEVGIVDLPSVKGALPIAFAAASDYVLDSGPLIIDFAQGDVRVPFLPGFYCTASTFTATTASGTCQRSPLTSDIVSKFELRKVEDSPDAANREATSNAAPVLSRPAAAASASQPNPVPPATDGAAACVGGRRACDANCLTLALRPSLETVGQIRQCRQKCKAACA